MVTDSYVDNSRVVRGLKAGPLGEHIHLYLGHLQRGGYSREVGHRLLEHFHDERW